MQAIVQLVFICILAALLWGVLGKPIGSEFANDHVASPQPSLLILDQTLRDVVRRIDKALDGDASLKPHNLSPPVGMWSLSALIANLLSAGLLLFMCIFGRRDHRARLRVIIGMIAMTAVVLTLLTAPLLYATVVLQDGRPIPIDAAFASLLIYLCSLATDTMGALDYPPDSLERSGFTAFIAAVDLPCIIVTALFSFCSFYIEFPPEFVVGTAAALLAYYSVAFFLLSTLNWKNSEKGKSMFNKIKGNVLVIIMVGAAINCVVGTIVQVFKLPIYLDLVGSFVVGALCGLVPAVLSAVIGVLLLGLTVSPIAIAYLGTAVMVAAAAVWLHPLGFMSNWKATVGYSFILGPLSTLLSAPVTVYLFGGVTLAGSDLVTAFFMSTGNTLFEAVVSGAVFFDLIDKVITSVIAFGIFRRIPHRYRTAMKE